ncbi:dihydrofolate reductase family protein [Microbacterium sp. NPDC091313]
MRPLTYFVAVSLDGRIAAPDGRFDAFPVEGDHIDMIFREWRDTLPTAAASALGLAPDGTRFDTVLMGWETYAAGLPHGVDDPYSHLRQYVLSRRHLDVSVPAGVTLTGEDPRTLVQRLKAEPGRAGIWLCGGGVLAAALADEIDRLVLKVNPVVLGAGRPLFAGDYSPRSFHLDRSESFASGVVVHEYRRR